MTIVLPSTMKAVEAAAAGPVGSTMKVVSDRPVPKLTESANGEEPSLIIKVECAALNPVDWKMVELDLFVSQWPHAFGCDASGTVVATSPGTEFNVGDKVWSFTLIGPPHAGSMAEYVRVPALTVGRVPRGMTMDSAATLGLCYLTAAFGLYKEMQLPTTAPEEGFPVLVYGASSTTGVFALSLLSAAGYRAIAVASAQHHAWLKEKLGAAQVVDYHEEGWKDAVAATAENKGMQYALDCIGGDTPAMLDKILEKCGAAGEGKIATVDLMAKLEGKSRLFAINTPAVQTGELLAEAGMYIKMVEKLLAEGKLVAMPTKVLGGLEEAPGGLELLKGGKVRREKLIVTV